MITPLTRDRITTGARRWYNNKDEATLEMAPKSAVDMRLYACRVVEEGELMLALVPAGPAAKKSWYLRAEDADSFDTWKWALCGAAGGGDEAVPLGREVSSCNSLLTSVQM